jgi:hypothetical protein
MPRTHAPARVTARRPNLALKSRKRTTSKRRPKTGKKRAKKTGARRRATKTPSRTALIDKLSAPQFLDLSIEDTYQVPADTVADGRGVLWADPSGFTAAASTDGNCTGTYDVAHLALMASKLDVTPFVTGIASVPTIGTSNFHYEIVKTKVNHQLVNMQSGMANITAFKCRARRDLPNSQAYGNGPVSTLGLGWVQNGVAVPAAGNFAMTPFQSPLFCSGYKITSVRNYVLEPGQQLTLSFKQGKRAVSMQQLSSVVDQTKTWLTANYDFCTAKGSEFYLFKISGQLLDFTATSTGPGYTTPKVFCTTTYNYEFKTAAQQKETIYKYNLGMNVGTAPQIINPLTGVLETPVTNPIVNA